MVSVVTELRREVSCFTPPDEPGELYLSCKTFGVISIVRARLGTRRSDSTTSLLAACDVSSISHVISARQHAERAISYRPSVCPSDTRVDQSKTVEVTIMQFSPHSSLIPLVFAG